MIVAGISRVNIFPGRIFITDNSILLSFVRPLWFQGLQIVFWVKLPVFQYLVALLRAEFHISWTHPWTIHTHSKTALQEADRHEEGDVLRDQTSLMLMRISSEHFSMHFCDAVQCCYCSLVPRPHPAFRRLQFSFACGESLGTRLLFLYGDLMSLATCVMFTTQYYPTFFIQT